MTRHRSIGFALVLLGSSLVACAVHDPRGVFNRSLAIGDRGISVPLPPPSLLVAPMQPVDVDAQVDDGGNVDALGVVAVIVEHRSGAEVEVDVSPGSSMVVVQLPEIDLRDNCLELWLEKSDGSESVHRFFSARIEDAQSIAVDEGCNE